MALAVAALAGVAEVGMAYESAYPRTEVGVIEVKTLPAATVMSAGMRGGDRNAAFRDLFRYIQDRKVPMTVPVELEQGTNSAMRFYLNRSLTNNLPAPSDTVALTGRSERTVVSLGLRGSYSEKHYSEALTRLAQWLTEHPEWAVAGDAYQVFWNSPFVPFFLKRSEVHLPVRRVEASAGEPGGR
jgi:hypothetical protein